MINQAPANVISGISCRSKGLICTTTTHGGFLLPNGTESPPVFWSNLDIEMVRTAPLETLLKWLLAAETKYQLPVPDNYTKMTVKEIRGWIEKKATGEIEEAGGISPGALKQIDERTKQEKKLQT